MRGYAISHVGILPGVEHFLLKGPNSQGRWYANPDQARGKLSGRLCIFSSIDEIRGFLEGDPSIRPIYDTPELFRLNPEFDPEKTFNVYELNDHRIPQNNPSLTFRSVGLKISRSR